jgi:hypothetical protein
MFMKLTPKNVLVGAATIGAGLVVAFYPPALVAGAIIGLSSSSVFSIFGAAAAHVATATLAVATSAATFGVARLLEAGYKFFGGLIAARKSKAQPKALETFDSEDHDADSSCSSSMSCLSRLGKGSKASSNPEQDLGQSSSLNLRRPTRQQPAPQQEGEELRQASSFGAHA